ncbi:MAG: T9SS type A sorting domain-containing protein [Bacteroidetes bacterium]|nr:T9SS type A sorting domain-containing protein [Bacteroidota bacterium]MBS1939506.1 T9SS type A sorting domain-containing protein [Bacteroidota bacterium]
MNAWKTAALLALCSMGVFSVTAQTVADARAAAIGSTVTVTGVVTSGPSLGSVRYLQDGTAGIAVFPGSGSAPGFNAMPGDDLTLTGTLTNYNGLLEITPITAFTVNSNGNALPAPQVISPDELAEPVESRIVQVQGVYFQGSGVFTAGTWTVQAGTQSANVYLRSGHPLIGTPVPAGPVDVAGIASQYDPSSPYTGGYQLLPRDGSDITPHQSISVMPPVQQSNLVPDGFHLAWQTNLPGSSQVFYGTTPELGSLAGSATLATVHDVQLTGLQAATFYYAQVFSVAGTDTAFSTIGYYSTASISSGTIAVYFTKSVDNSVSNGTNAIGLFSATDDTIKAYIDRVQNTLDIAMYNTNSTFVVAAVNAAKARGVQVRWIAEGSNANTALAGLDPSIPVLYRTDGLGSGMHNKFFIADVEDPQHAMVMGGSCNWTTQSFFEDYNNILFIQDQALARCYTMEFNEMWGGSGPQPVPAFSLFGPDKTDNTPHLFNVGGKAVASYFSPSDGVADRIVDLLNHAQNSVQLALYVFTDNDLGDAVLAAYERPGMTVQGDVEDVYSSGSEFNYLVGQGIDLHSHLDEPGLLHHKYAILDQAAGPDPLVETGSHNWTSSASTVNDENSLVIHDATVANIYYQEWYARHYGPTAIAEDHGTNTLLAWPVPAQHLLNVKLAENGNALLELMDATGRVMYRSEVNGTATVNVGNFAPGLYTLTCIQGDNLSRRSVLVVR